METRTIDVSEVESRFAEVLALAKHGHTVVIAEAGTAVARLVPVAPPIRARAPGLHRGMGWIGDDFDQPLPDEFWLASE
jgi:antitoxin (DNA-binding transcriptional repressor) of toxin-antitoxin stability system